MNLISSLDNIVNALAEGKLQEALQLEKAVIDYCKTTTSPTVKVVLSVMTKDHDSAIEKIEDYTVLIRHLSTLWEVR